MIHRQSCFILSTKPGDDNAIFSLSSSVITSIHLMDQPPTMQEYRAYVRTHGHVFSNVPVEGEVWISNAWGGYHAWEDGRYDQS